MVNALRQRSIPVLLCILCIAVFFNLVSVLLPDNGLVAKIAVVAVAFLPALICLAIGLLAYLTIRRRTVLAIVAAACVMFAAAPWAVPVYGGNAAADTTTVRGQSSVTVAFANMYRGGASESDVLGLVTPDGSRAGNGELTPQGVDLVIAAESHYEHQRRVTNALAKTHQQVRLTGRYGAGETLGVWLSRSSRWMIHEGAYTPLGARVFRLTLTESQGDAKRTIHVIGLHAHHPLFEPIADWNHDLAAAAAALQTADGPAVVIGDFNQSLASPRLALWAKRNNLYSCRSRRQNLLDGTWAPPQGLLGPVISIDHVFTRDAVCKDTETVALSKSDHHGVVASVSP